MFFDLPDADPTTGYPADGIFTFPFTGGNEPVSYADFRPPITWDSIRDELQREQDVARAEGQYMFVSRGTVLGRWRQRKREAYAGYLKAFQAEAAA